MQSVAYVHCVGQDQKEVKGRYATLLIFSNLEVRIGQLLEANATLISEELLLKNLKTI